MKPYFKLIIILVMFGGKLCSFNKCVFTFYRSTNDANWSWQVKDRVKSVFDLDEPGDQP